MKAINMEKHDNRAEATLHSFLQDVCRTKWVTPENAASAALAVLSALEQRMPAQISEHLEAQLPSLLANQLMVRRSAYALGHAKPDRRQLLAKIADELDVTESYAEKIMRAVLWAVQIKISTGAAEHVAAALPEELKIIWRYPLGEFIPGKT